LRHGQATHNPRAEEAKAQGCSHETFMELMRQDDSLDSELTELGRLQAKNVCETFNSHWGDFDLVVSSPLSRALQTAELAVPPNIQNRLCYEDFREINGWLLNAKRRAISELKELFPRWNLEHLKHADDVYWTPTLESTTACGERGYQGLQWILERPEEKILLVTHGGILRFTMTEHPNVKVQDARQQGTDRPAVSRFCNCELRRYQINWEEHSNDEGKVVLTEVDVDDDQDSLAPQVAVSQL